MLTNCPNCGAPLTKDGWCDYCQTKVRLANLMEIDNEYMKYHPVEILLRFKNPDGVLILMPFKGHLSSVDVHFDTLDIGSPYGFSGYYRNPNPQIHLELDGHMCDLPEAEKKEVANEKNNL